VHELHELHECGTITIKHLELGTAIDSTELGTAIDSTTKQVDP